MFETVKTPCYIVDEKKLRSNLEILKRVQEEADCKILLAQKAFSMFRVYPLISVRRIWRSWMKSATM